MGIKTFILNVLGANDEIKRLSKENGDLRIALYHLQISYDVLERKHKSLTEIDDNKEVKKKS